MILGQDQKIRVRMTGNPLETKIEDAETGSDLTSNVSKVVITQDAFCLPTVELTLFNADVDCTGVQKKDQQPPVITSIPVPMLEEMAKGSELRIEVGFEKDEKAVWVRFGGAYPSGIAFVPEHAKAFAECILHAVELSKNESDETANRRAVSQLQAFAYGGSELAENAKECRASWLAANPKATDEELDSLFSK